MILVHYAAFLYSGSQENEVYPMPYARRVPPVTEKGYNCILHTQYSPSKLINFFIISNKSSGL
jgi:hypothetical protein